MRALIATWRTGRNGASELCRLALRPCYCALVSATGINSSVDPSEVERFSALADRWWDANGPMRPLHRLNPVRLRWIRDQICRHFERDPVTVPALSGLRVLDIGCGAGLVAEPLRRMGADVVAIDPSQANIKAARLHAEEGGLDIDYRATTAEELALLGEVFDVVLILEVVEHVTDVARFIATCSTMVRRNGLLLASTINRTPKAFLLAIIGAEYVLRWLPRGTHSYNRLVTPGELSAAFRIAELEPSAETGVVYSPIADAWRLANDLEVNYMMAARAKT